MNILSKIRTRIHITNINPLVYEVRKVIEDDRIKINTLATNIKSEPYTPKKNDKIYFIPGTTIPRFKIKDFCEAYKVSIVKYKDKADVCFIGPDSYKELLYEANHNSFRKSDMVSYFENNLRLTMEGRDKFLKDLKDTDSTVVTVYYVATDGLKKGILGQVFDKEGSYIYNAYFKDKKSYEAFVTIQNSNNIYDQKEILSKLNTIVMDEANYVSIQRMLKSSDKNNLKLGMETMANCDYQKSAVYLLLLLKEFGEQIYYASSFHHVNFKALLKFFDISNVRGICNDDIIKALIDTKLLNQTNLDKIAPFVMDKANDRTGTVYFTVKGLENTDVIDKALNENVLDIKADTEIHKDSQDELLFKNMPILN